MLHKEVRQNVLLWSLPNLCWTNPGRNCFSFSNQPKFPKFWTSTTILVASSITSWLMTKQTEKLKQRLFLAEQKTTDFVNNSKANFSNLVSRKIVFLQLKNHLPMCLLEDNFPHSNCFGSFHEIFEAKQNCCQGNITLFWSALLCVERLNRGRNWICHWISDNLWKCQSRDARWRHLGRQGRVLTAAHDVCLSVCFVFFFVLSHSQSECVTDCQLFVFVCSLCPFSVFSVFTHSLSFSLFLSVCLSVFVSLFVSLLFTSPSCLSLPLSLSLPHSLSSFHLFLSISVLVFLKDGQFLYGSAHLEYQKFFVCAHVPVCLFDNVCVYVSAFGSAFLCTWFFVHVHVSDISIFCPPIYICVMWCLLMCDCWPVCVCVCVCV